MAVAVNLHFLEGADERGVAREDHFLPAAGAPFKHHAIFVVSLDERFDRLAEERLPLFIADLLLKIDEALEPLLLHLWGDVVFPADCGGSFAGTV